MKSNVGSTTELFQDGSNKDSLEIRKNRPVKEPSFGNCSYIVILVIMCVMAALFFALWIADLCTQFVPWNNNTDMFNSTGIICQVITALISCVVSVLGISFSIQDYEKFDTKIKDLLIEQYRRSDGQYFFEGVFMSRDEVAKCLKNKYHLLVMEIRIAVKSEKLGIYEFEFKRDA